MQTPLCRHQKKNIYILNCSLQCSILRFVYSCGCAGRMVTPGLILNKPRRHNYEKYLAGPLSIHIRPAIGIIQTLILIVAPTCSTVSTCNARQISVFSVVFQPSEKSYHVSTAVSASYTKFLHFWENRAFVSLGALSQLLIKIFHIFISVIFELLK